MAVLFATDDVGSDERFEYWAHSSSTLFAPLTSAPVTGAARFWGVMRGARLGAVQLSAVSAAAHTIRRTARQIAIDDPELFWLSLQLRGTSTIVQADRSAALRPGDLALYDSSHPYAIVSAAPMEMAVFQLPRALIRSVPALMAGLTATRIGERSGAGPFVTPYLRGLSEGLRDDTLPERCDELGDGVVDLVNAIFAPRLTAPAPAGAAAAKLPQVMAFIDAHLADERLTPDTIARANYVSTRYLYRLFEAEGTGVAEWIRHRRLERCRRDLRDPALAEVPVARIALQWGFRNPEPFSRAFRAAYGCAPGAYRAGRGDG